MAGSFKKLHQQSFTDSSNITVTHNQNKVGLGVMVTSASIARPDIINYIKFTPGNERNQFIINLTAQSSGEILVVESDYMWTNTPVPEVMQALSGSYMEAGGDIVLGTAGSTIKMPNDLQITGSVTATGQISSSGALYGEDLFLGSNARINSSVASEIKVLLPLNVSGNITASGNISMPTNASSINMVNGSIYSRNGGSYPGIQLNSGVNNNTIWFLAGNNDSIGGEVTASFVSSGFINNVGIVRARSNSSLLLQGGPAPNDANDGVKIETADASNVYQPRFQIESDTTNVDAYFTNINGLGINDSTPTAMLDVNGNINTTSNITASGDISASGEFIGASAYITNITASANISASGYVETDLVQSSNAMVITGSNFYIDSNGRYDFDYNITRVETHNMTGDVDNFNPTGFQDCNLINVTSDAGGYEISGIVAPSPAYARVFYFQNANTGNSSIKFMNNNGSATTGNKIFLRDRANKDLKEQECAGLWYDVTADSGNGGWRPLTRLG